MGMSIDAMLIYGIPYKEIPEELIEQVDEMLDEGTLDYASPWYDSSREDWIVGIEVDMWGDTYSSADSELYTTTTKVPDILKGCKFGFYVSPHVT